jgi:hypothetical protein
MTRIAAILLVFLAGLAVPAGAQNFGNIPPGTVLGNPSTTAKQPAQPIPSNNVVTPAQFKVAADPDDTNSIIAALATCHSVELQANVTYTISKPLPLCPGGKQQVSGHSGSVIKLAATWDATQHTPCSAASDSATWRPVFYNPNCGGAVHNFVDKNIYFSGFTIDGSAVAVPTLGQTVAIFLRNAQYVGVDKITCIGFADCTAMLASQYTTVTNSIAIDNMNSGFDFWDSPLDATVAFDTVMCTGATQAGQYGFNFNSSDTLATHPGDGVNYLSVGNKAVGCGTALDIDPLFAGGTIIGVVVSDFVVDGSYGGRGQKSGITVWGNVVGATLSNILVQNLVDGYALTIDQNSASVPGVFPHAITVQGLKILNSSNLTINDAMITVKEGGSATGTDRVTGVTFGPASYYPAGANRFQYAIDADTTGTVIEGQFPTSGSLGLATSYANKYPNIINLNYDQATAGACGTAPVVSGISARGAVQIGTGTVTQCTVLFGSQRVFATPPVCTLTPSINSTVTTPFPGTVAVASTIQGINLYSSVDMHGYAFNWQCSPL